MLAIADNETPIICNGFKDDEYIEMVMLAKKIGRQIIPVVEKYTELDLILKHSAARRRAARHRAAPQAGEPRLGTLEILRRLSFQVRAHGDAKPCRRCEQMKAAGMEDCLQLLHFHLGSQITNIRQIKARGDGGARAFTWS